jgi:hypothetical protein
MSLRKRGAEGTTREIASVILDRVIGKRASERSRRQAGGDAAYQFKPHERPFMPGSPATPEHPGRRRLAYFVIGVLLALTGGFANGLLVAALPQIQGALGLTSTEGGWLVAVWSMTSVCTSMILLKFRQQFGLRRFALLVLPTFVLLNMVQWFNRSFEVELVVRALGGVVGSGLSTFALFYIMQGMPAAARLGGMVLGVGLSQVALPFARVLAPLLLAGGDVHDLFAFELGLAMLCTAAAAMLPLPPAETFKAFEPLDGWTFLLFAPGVALLCAVLALGRVVWWDVPWLGYAVAGAILLVSAAMLIEHNRADPLLNIRWMASADIVRFALLGATMRLLLSEQNFGSAGLLASVGMGADQMVIFYTIVTLASVAGLVASLVTLNPRDLAWPVLVSTALIAIGAWMDSDASNLTRPSSLYLSQGLIAFAAIFFMGPLMMSGVLRALARGPSHMISFTAVFSISQTLGGLGGAALLGTFQVARERAHSEALVQMMSITDPQVAARLAALGGAYARVLTDPVLRQAQGGALLSQQVVREANILAFNDVFLLIAALAATAFVLMGARWLYNRRHGINPLGEELALLARMRAARENG